MSKAVHKNILIVANGETISFEEITKWKEGASFVIATDGALSAFPQNGLEPNLLVGDFDSVDKDQLSKFKGETLRLPDQESTDFQKSVSIALSMEPIQVVVLGIEGSRLDHTLSAINFASRFSSRTQFRFPMKASVVHIISQKWTSKAQIGGHLSIIPLPEVKFSYSEGLEWPVAGISMSVGGRDGISNLAIRSEVSLEVESGCAAVFLQRFEGDVGW